MANPVHRRAEYLLLIAFTLVGGCGGDSAPSKPLDLGGGIFMSEDGAMIGATPLGPPQPDFLSAGAEEWKSFADRKLSLESRASP